LDSERQGHHIGNVRAPSTGGPARRRRRVAKSRLSSAHVREDGGVDAEQQMRAIMESMTNGDLRPFFDAMSDDVTWQWMGVTSWSKTFSGKKEVVGGLFGGVARDLTHPFSVQLRSIVADGDDVVVEHTGRNTTRDGRQYNNNYCWIFHFRDGFILEVREYMDTQLVTETFTG
jgi:uncharacterized protein